VIVDNLMITPMVGLAVVERELQHRPAICRPAAVT
jgi:hypothetical protein